MSWEVISLSTPGSTSVMDATAPTMLDDWSSDGNFPSAPILFLDKLVGLRRVFSLEVRAVPFEFLPVRRATFPSRTISVRRAPYSKLLLAGFPPLHASSQSR